MDKNSITYEQVGVLIEDLKSQFRVVAEGQTGLRDELKKDMAEKFEFLNDEISVIKKAVTTTSKTVNKLEGKVDNLEVKFDKLENKVDNLEVKFDKLENKVDNLEVKVDNIQADVSEIKFDIQLMREGFSDHEHRIKKLEMA